MKKKNIIIGLLLVLIISLSLVFLNPNIRKSFKRLFANINDATSASYKIDKVYNLNDEVYYNPVSNTWCTSEDEANNCFAWYVIGNTYSKLELMYKKDNDSFKVPSSSYFGTNTMVDVVNDITSNWSSDLSITNPKYKTISSKYPAPVSDYPEVTLDFSSSKARLPYKNEIPNSLLNVLKTDLYCGVRGYPCIGIYNINGEETSSNYNQWAAINTNYFNVSTAGGLQVTPPPSGFYIHPIIEVERETYEINVTPKELFNDERTYLVGLKGVVYLDPTDLTRTCTKADSDANVNSNGTPTNIKEGCMKWYIIGEEGDSYKLLLDHNSTALAIYNRGNDSSNPREAMQVLNSDIANWDIPARLPSMYDIGEAVGVKYSDSTTNSLYYPYTSTMPSNYAYLLDYLDQTASPGETSTKVDSNYYTAGDGYGTYPTEAYWTSTPADSIKVKTVDESGSISYRNAYSSSSTGIRPLITLPKTVFYEGLDVTYIDEDSVTTKPNRYNTKIEAIEPQGKTGYLFDHWSLERNGETFDFDTKITSNTTLYAVYKTRNCITETYELGEIVYFDPVTDNKCDETTFSVDNINNGTSTCYRWRVINTDDSLDKNTFELMLDHNLINTVSWSSSSDVYLPDKSLSDLAALTSSWTKVKNLDYSYDTTQYETNSRRHYGYLKCVNGTCTATKDGTSTTVATNVKARMITIDEVQNMINSVNSTKIFALELNATYIRDLQSLKTDAITLDNHLITSLEYSNNNGAMYSVGIKNNTSLAWLGENTDHGVYATATDNLYGDNNSGYYTLTPYPIADYNKSVWGVWTNNVSTSSYYNDPNTVNKPIQGVRPVIQLEKENLCKNVLVTYNDEDRIEEEEIEINTQALNKDSKGKEGHTFKYWSLEKSGTEFDFDTPITHNTTLYAVYEINKFNVEFYDDNTKIKTVVINYRNTINNTDVPTVSKEGYTFTAWSLENEEEGFDFTTEITTDLKLYSNYKVIENEVIFNDENRITTKVVVWGKKVTPLDNLGKEGYTFKYWSLEKNGTEFDFDTQIKSSTTLYAVYEIITYDVEFYVDNEIVETLTIDYNGVINENDIPNAEKETYKFLGWREEDSEDNFDFDTHILKNYKLYSYYEPIIDPVPDDECSLDITSSLYRVDNKKFVISLVPKDETIEQIVEHLTIQATLKEVSGEKIVICCEDETRVYTIERYWMPHTGNIVFRYGTIITLIILPIMLLVFINKQRTKNKELKYRL